MEKEIRCVVRSDRNPETVILHRTRSSQKVHLVSKDSRVNVGDYVTAWLVRDLDCCVIYHCDPIPKDRMVVRVILAQDFAQTFVEYQGESERYWWSHYKWFESMSELVTHHQFTGGRFSHNSHQEWLMLIRSGCEESVKQALQ